MSLSRTPPSPSAEGSDVPSAEHAWAETLAHLPVPAILVTSDAVYFNALAETATGYSHGRLTTRNALFSAFFGDKSNERLTDYESRRAARTELVFPIVCGDGNTRVFDVLASSSDRGDIWVLKEISEPIASASAVGTVQLSGEQEDLRRSQAFLHSIVENIPNMIFVKEARELRFIRFNKAGEDLIGVSRSDLLGKNDSDIFPEEQAKFFVEKDRQVLAGGTVVLIPEEPIDSPGLGRRYLRTRKIPIRDATGEPQYLLGISEDITDIKHAADALRETEERFRNVADSAPVLIWRTGTDSLCFYVNKPWLDFTGRTLEEELGNGWTDRIHQDDAATFADAYLNAFEERRELRETYRLQRHDGEFRWMMGHGIPLYHDEEFAGYVGSMLDVTELRAAEEEVRLAKESAEEASRYKSQFLANMSHEIRTPLNGILGLTDLLLDSMLSGEQRNYLETVKLCADTLLTVVNDVLDFSKIEAGKLEIHREPFDVRLVVSEIDELFRLRLTQKALSFSSSIADGLPARVVGDSFRLRQVLINLVGNAVKFTPQGGRIALSVSLEQRMPGSLLLLFTVSDTGIGITPAQQQLIFRAFTQADASTTRDFGGTGLGLTISSQLVELMGGRMSVVSEPAKGSMFSFTLLLQELAADHPPERAPLSDTRKFRALRPLTILVAEDNSVNQTVAQRILEKEGHTVVLAANGEEALLRHAERSFDVILMDIQMPVMDGYTAVAEIRSREAKRDHRTPIVALTAHAMAGDRERCLQAGMDSFVSKPFNRKELLARIYEIAIPQPRR